MCPPWRVNRDTSEAARARVRHIFFSSHRSEGRIAGALGKMSKHMTRQREGRIRPKFRGWQTILVHVERSGLCGEIGNLGAWASGMAGGVRGKTIPLGAQIDAKPAGFFPPPTVSPSCSSTIFLPKDMPSQLPHHPPHQALRHRRPSPSPSLTVPHRPSSAPHSLTQTPSGCGSTPAR